jgi:hypothetical protein
VDEGDVSGSSSSEEEEEEGEPGLVLPAVILVLLRLDFPDFSPLFSCTLDDPGAGWPTSPSAFTAAQTEPRSSSQRRFLMSGRFGVGAPEVFGVVSAVAPASVPFFVVLLVEGASGGVDEEGEGVEDT